MRTAKELLSTYPEIRDSKWGQIVINAESNKGFSEEDSCQAMSWITCACGQCEPGLMSLCGGPKDSIMYQLGLEFGTAVNGNYFYNAAHLLIQINLREQYLLANLEE